MKRYLITGAAGFIGSHVAELLLSRGDEVVGLDEVNDYYSVENKHHNIDLLSKHPNFTFLRGDIADRQAVEAIFAQHKITHVGHLAARAGVRPSLVDPYLYQRANCEGTLVLLDVARRSEVENFVLTSSSSVYGNSTRIPFQEDDSATDRPVSPYAATKKATEVMGFTFHHLYGLNVNVIRPFTVYGPRGRPDMAPWLFLVAALKGRPIRKFGDGSTRRDYTYIGDFAKGFVNALDRAFGYEIFNLGNSATVSLNEALAIVSDVTGKELVIEPYPPQPGDVDITNADIGKARTMLSYDPSTSFREGMALFHEWFVSRHSL
jgi:UDP-glucuronate 4-epimerase